MNFLVITASPNKDGLTAACAKAACAGILRGGAKVKQVHLNDLSIGMCQACNDGWGTCLSAHHCQVEDDFQALHERLARVNGLVLVSPVYWGDLSESTKAFTDRLRRCEATRDRGQSILFEKPVVAVAAAGGSGNGTITCLLNMERWIQHIQARPFDLIPVTRWSRAYKLTAIRAAGRAMAEEFRQKGKRAD